MAYTKEEECYFGWIYLCTNSITKKQYIGQTTYKSPEKRWGQHLSGKDDNYFSRSINAHGKENFEFKTILRLSAPSIKELKKALDFQEQRFIKDYNTLKPNGYNLTAGGNSGTKVNTTPKEYENVKIDVYDLSLNLIEIYENAYICSLETNINIKYIIQCCLGDRLSFQNKIFRFHGDSVNKYPHFRYAIDQYDMDLNFIQRWDKARECELYYGWSAGSISKAISRKTSLYDFIFCKSTEEPTKPKSYKKPVYMCELDTLKIIKHFETIKAAEEFSGYHSRYYGDFITMLKRNNYVFNGYKWLINSDNYKE